MDVVVVVVAAVALQMKTNLSPGLGPGVIQHTRGHKMCQRRKITVMIMCKV